MRLPLLCLFLVFFNCAFAQNDKIIHKRHKYVFSGENKLFKTRYDSIRNFSEGRAAVLKKGKWGFIDDSGEVVIPRTYAGVTDFHGGLAGAQDIKYRGWSVIDPAGISVSYSSYQRIEFVDSFAIGIRGYAANGFQNKDVFHYKNGRSAFENVVSIYPRKQGYLFISYGKYCNGKWDGFTGQIVNGSGTAITPLFIYDESILIQNTVVSDCEHKKVAIVSPELKVSQWYNSIGPEQNGFRIVERSHIMGAINSSLDEIIPVQYYSVAYAGNNFIVQNYSGMRLYDTAGIPIGDFHTAITYIGEGIYSVHNQFGYDYSLMKADGDTLPGHYHTIHEFHNGLVRVTSADGMRFGYVNPTGQLVAGWYPRGIEYHPPSSYNDIGGTIFRIFMGIVSAGMTEAFHAFDGMGGEQNTPESYTDFYGSDFENGYAYYTVRRSSPYGKQYHEERVSYGVIDSTGKVILPARYTAIEQLDTFFLVAINDNYGMYSRHGKQVLPVQYTRIASIGNGFFEVQNGSGWSTALFKYDGAKGKFLTPFIYDHFKDGGDSILIAESWPKYGYIDYNGKVLVRPKYSQAYPFRSGRAQVSFDYNGGLFYIDRRGRRIE